MTPTLATTVRVERSGQLSRFHPLCPEAIAAFRTKTYMAEDESRHGYALGPCFPSLLWVNERLGKEWMVCHAGLEPLVIEFLTRRGCRIVRESPAPLPLPPPREEADSARKSSGIIPFVQSRDRGLIRCAPGAIPVAGLVAEIAQAWPQAKILALVTRIRDASRLRDQLEDLGLKPAVFTSQHHSDEIAQVAIATYGHAASGAVGLEKRTIAIALHPVEMLHHDRGWDCIERLWAARLYGLLPIDAKLVPYDRDLLLALYGAQSVRIARHDPGTGQAEVNLVFLTSPPGRPVAPGLNALELKRQAVWLNRSRNRRIARLARALAEGDRACLAAEFQNVLAGIARLPAGRVGVLVDGVEHGLALAAHLPGWPLVAHAEAFDAGLSEADRQTLYQGRNRRRRTTAHVLVTQDGLDRCGRLDALIQAEGGTGIPEFREGFTPPWIVDLVDRHAPALRQQARTRKAAYREAGWTSAETSHISPLDQFLASRPEAIRE